MGKVNKIINGRAHYYRFFLWADRKKRLEAVGYMVNFASRITNKTEMIMKELKGNINEKVSAALAAAKTPGQQKALLALASNRHVKGVADQVLALAEDNDAEVAAAALKALPNVVGTKDASRVAERLDKAGDAQASAYLAALQASIATQDAQTQYQTISTEIQKATNKARFYPALAATGTDESVAYLQQTWEKEKSAKALEALKKSNNFIFSQFLGCCPFLGCSSKVDTAIGMGLAVTFVMGLASAICYIVDIYILVPLNLQFLETLAFIVIIALFCFTVGMLLSINGTYQRIFLSSDKITEASIKYGNAYFSAVILYRDAIKSSVL